MYTFWFLQPVGQCLSFYLTSLYIVFFYFWFWLLGQRSSLGPLFDKNKVWNPEKHWELPGNVTKYDLDIIDVMCMFDVNYWKNNWNTYAVLLLTAKVTNQEIFFSNRVMYLIWHWSMSRLAILQGCFTSLVYHIRWSTSATAKWFSYTRSK